MPFLLNQSGDLILGSGALLTMDFGGLAPSTVGSIPTQTVTQNAGDRVINLDLYFSGTSLTYSLQSAVAGVSISSNLLTIVDDNLLSSATVTVLASNAFGPDVSQVFSRSVIAASANWYDAVFGLYTGATPVGSRSVSPTAAATWAAATSGVSDNGTTITVSGASLTDSDINMDDRRLLWSGNNGSLTDFGGQYKAGGANLGNWQINGDNMLMEYFTIDNETSPVTGDPSLFFHATAANGTHTIRYGHIKSSPTDCIKAPNNGTIQMEYMFFDGYYLGASGVHTDLVDMKAAGAASYIKDSLFVGDLHPSSPFDASTPSTGLNAMIRCIPGDAHGYDGSGRTYERCIMVGSDDVNATATLLSFSGPTATGITFYDILIDLREHNNLASVNIRVEDWKVNAIDWAQCVSDGFITVGAEIPFPNLGSQPATVPSTMVAPVITGGTGVINWADNTRPWNQRSLITQYDLRYSTDGTNWTVVNDVSLTAGSTAVAAGSNYRIQFRAVNSIGAAAWSPSSNLVTVS